MVCRPHAQVNTTRLTTGFFVAQNNFFEKSLSFQNYYYLCEVKANQTTLKKQLIMKKNTFTVAEIPGAKRQSHREYTHAVIGVYNWDTRLPRDDYDSFSFGSNFDYYVMCVNTGLGNQYRSGNMLITVDEKMYNNYAPIVEQFKNRDAYIAHLRAERVKFCKEQMLKPEKLVVLRWSQSYANACKGHGEFSCYKNIRVVPVVKA